MISVVNSVSKLWNVDSWVFDSSVGARAIVGGAADAGGDVNDAELT